MNGVFTTIKVANGVSLFLERHAERLKEGIGYRGKGIDLSLLIQKFIKEEQIINAALRVDALENGEIIFKSRHLPKNGTLVKAVTFTASEKLPKIKQIDRHVYEQAQVYAKERGADVGIFIIGDKWDKGSKIILLESTISNIISLDKNGDIVTPPLTTQGLKGITRQVLLDGKYAKEREISVDTKGPIVLVNCLRVQGVNSLDGRRLKDPRGLMKRLQALLSMR